MAYLLRATGVHLESLEEGDESGNLAAVECSLRLSVTSYPRHPV